ncbi:uncharacterized protein LOC127841744 isoform X2 [Dreissena polymorpha]|uniref:uncharacterized protein LOC127841744 isoform X2 n=1 Tax=Dreissena polymorpha TaxID=45954 RepID=UPI00226428F7|nr:uncharacterized protein LOC127841744 isoform X2 [Dreissena polymorpha]
MPVGKSVYDVDCTWYMECLSKLDNCTEKATSYAIGFGETICTEFRTRRGEFSLVGQKWINSTTACLQKKLVTALTPKEPMTCEEVQTFAFHTHSSCYTDTPLGAPSFCDLDFADWLRVSWIVKQALVRETSQTVQQAAQILGHCASHLLG